MPKINSAEKRKAQQRLCQKRRYQEINNDPVLLAVEQEKRRQKYKKRKEEGKLKPISDLTSRAQREQRKKWKENSKRYRLRRKETVEKTKEFNTVMIETAEEPSGKPETEDPLLQFPEENYKSIINKAVRRIRYNENKKNKKLFGIIKNYKKKIDSQRKIIERLNKKLERQAEQIYFNQIRKNKCLSTETVQKWYVDKIQQFYNDDANSTIRAGKKEFITKNKVKMQKRYLNAPLKLLYRKFLSDTDVRVSYSYFCKHRPFWIVFPKPANRDTCLCSRHVNIDLLVQALHKANILNIKSSEDLLSKLCCDSRNGACLNRSCNICSSNRLKYFNVSDDNILFYEWEKVIKEIILKNGTKKKQQVTQKIKKTMSISSAINKLEANLLPFFSHVYKIVMQYNAIKTLKQNLTLQEALVHVDFSENYSVKFAAEVQSFHFGGSRQQISLHTSVTYTHNFSTGSVTPLSICTIADCLRHDAAAIWAHLVPLVEHVLKVNPFIDTLHFLSDSPSSQYRNKYMFFIIGQIHKNFPQIMKITWNYSEAGHGKGAPDGIGAVLKRSADRMVSFGEDVGTFDQFYEKLRKTVENVIIVKVEESEITAKDLLIPKNLKAFKGTLSVYQILWDVTVKQTVARNLSCFDCSDASKTCLHGFDIGRIQNSNLDNVENIDPSYVAPLSKLKNKNETCSNINTNKITVLSDITIKDAYTFDPFQNLKSSTPKI